MQEMPPRWTEKYVGIPFRLDGRSRLGCDCFGLCQLIMAEEANISVTRDDVYVGSWSNFDLATITKRMGIPPWTNIMGPKDEALTQAFDWVLMRGLIGWTVAPVHVGIISAPGWILHIQERSLSRQQPIRELRDRIMFYGRHDAMTKRERHASRNAL